MALTGDHKTVKDLYETISGRARSYRTPTHYTADDPVFDYSGDNSFLFAGLLAVGNCAGYHSRPHPNARSDVHAHATWCGRHRHRRSADEYTPPDQHAHWPLESDTDSIHAADSICAAAHRLHPIAHYTADVYTAAATAYEYTNPDGDRRGYIRLTTTDLDTFGRADSIESADGNTTHSAFGYACPISDGGVGQVVIECSDYI